MPSPERRTHFVTEPMARVAVVALDRDLRTALVEVADSGVVELDEAGDAENEVSAALRGVERSGAPQLSRERPDVHALAAAGRADLLEGELDLSRHAAAAVSESGVSALLGWMPEAAVPALRRRLDTHDGRLVVLPRPSWPEPPTLVTGGRLSRELHPLVDVYGPIRYRDIDPTPFAAASFVLMFGMMFADAGHGLILVAAGLVARLWPRAVPGILRAAWLYVLAAGASATVFGVVFGEVFGPSHLAGPLWTSPLEQPLQLIIAALGVGASFLAISYVIGTVNRFREGGLLRALTASNGAGGLTLFAGAALAAFGLARGDDGLLPLAGTACAVTGLVLVIIGMYSESGRGMGAVPEVVVGAVDTVVRIGSNVLSFSRLAAFALVHAALGALVWDHAAQLWSAGGASAAAGAAVFLAGNAIGFALEGLVVGVQALRLEYYELFSRIFTGEGRRFTPWRLTVISEDSA